MIEGQVTAFDLLYKASVNPRRLADAYDSALHKLFSNQYWKKGGTTLQRVPWKLGTQARAQDPASFRLPGLYVWGAENRPLYLGRTNDTFERRFSRYIWHPQSQCCLARDYGSALKENGMDGFPKEVLGWYRKAYRGSVRLEGAIRFAKEGIEDVWFALFPSHGQKNAKRVSDLERKLIPVADNWNTEHGLDHLLNKQDQSSTR